MGLDSLVNQSYSKLNDSDKYIWKFICQNKEICKSITIEELSKKCLVSRTTVLRFAKKIGLDGFSELKYQLRNETIQTDNAINKLVNSKLLFESHARMIKDLYQRDYSLFCEIIQSSKRIYIVSTGTIQELVAKELKRQFLKLGIVMTNIRGDGEINILRKNITPGDTIIFISLRGENKNLLNLARHANLHDVNTISLTSMSSNSLATIVDDPIFIVFGSVPIEYEQMYVSSTMYFAVTELLFATYYNQISGDNQNETTTMY